MKTKTVFFLLLAAAAARGPVKAGAADVVLSFTELVLINGGMFVMGSPENGGGDSVSGYPQHHVLVGSFYIGRYEVTQKEYEDVMGVNPSRFKGPDLPVEGVSWYDAVEFCNRLSGWERLTPAYTIDKTRRDPGNKNTDGKTGWLVTWNRDADGYRLPTEAEWEYACRAGTPGPFSTGKTITAFDANYNGQYPYGTNPRGEYRGQTTAAGSFAPNAWGLHDMHGNVGEWCWDWSAGYSGAAETDPAGAVSGALRVIRGGSYDSGGQGIRSSARDHASPDTRGSGTGFRVVRGGRLLNAPAPRN